MTRLSGIVNGILASEINPLLLCYSTYYYFAVELSSFFGSFCLSSWGYEVGTRSSILVYAVLLGEVMIRCIKEVIHEANIRYANPNR